MPLERGNFTPTLTWSPPPPSFITTSTK
jgi:hypothetical protein